MFLFVCVCAYAGSSVEKNRVYECLLSCRRSTGIVLVTPRASGRGAASPYINAEGQETHQESLSLECSPSRPSILLALYMTEWNHVMHGMDWSWRVDRAASGLMGPQVCALRGGRGEGGRGGGGGTLIHRLMHTQTHTALAALLHRWCREQGPCAAAAGMRGPWHS